MTKIKLYLQADGVIGRLYQKISKLSLIRYCQNKKIGYNWKSDTQGRVAELVDAPHSKCGGREVIGVRFSSCPFTIDKLKSQML
jgi:hypothetical protein